MERKSGAMPLMFVKMFVATVSPEIHWTSYFKKTILGFAYTMAESFQN